METELEAWVPDVLPVLCGLFVEPCALCESAMEPPQTWSGSSMWAERRTETIDPRVVFAPPSPEPEMVRSRECSNMGELLCRETFEEVIAD